MQLQTVPQTAPSGSELLADPAQVALLRDLFAHARKVRADHATYSIEGGTGQRSLPKEHTWTLGHDRVSFCAGWLVYQCGGTTLMTARVDSVDQVAQLLAAVGALPERFAGGAR